jgi:hypothetical protein
VIVGIPWRWAALVLSGCTQVGTVGIEHDAGASTSATGTSGNDVSASTGDAKLDAGGGACDARTGQDVVPPCDEVAPAGSFDATLQWAWQGDADDIAVYVAPLVANLTDDDNNDRIDLCDGPDIVAIVGPDLGDSPALADAPAHLYVLDGKTGGVHARLDVDLHPTWSPALGDLDGDGVIEIVAMKSEIDGAGARIARPIALHVDGTIVWEASVSSPDWQGAMSIADLDGDGDAETLVDAYVLGADGGLVMQAPVGARGTIPVAVDLDDDGRQEVLYGAQAIDLSGAIVWDTQLTAGHGHVAGLDDDVAPEILLTSIDGLSWIEHDGTISVANWRPMGIVGDMRRPAAIADIDGDRGVEIIVAIGSDVAVLSTTAGPPGFALRSLVAASITTWGPGSTAFDFLGDAAAEVLFADEYLLHAFDAGGTEVLQADRASLAIQDFPIVADVDNDGSAEIVVAGNIAPDGTASPPIQVYGDTFDRWVPTRRIWNQHAYHVTNVEENGAIPRRELAHWGRVNAFRVNAQIRGGQVCVPEP